MKVKARFLLNAFALVCLFLLPATSVFAQSMRFLTYDPCGGGNSSFCAPRLVLKGTIEPDTAKKLDAFLGSRAAEDAYVSKKYHPYVVFDSPGGSLVGAIELGRYIRASRLDTILEPEITDIRRDDTQPDGFRSIPISKRAICASACSLAFLGGVNRVVTEGARLGVHQFSGANGDVGESASQTIVTQVAMYVQEMGVDRRLIDLASSTPASSMYWLDANLVRSLQVDNTKPKLTPWRIEADAQGRPSLVMVQGLQTKRRLGLFVSVEGGWAIIDVAAVFDRGAIGQARLAQYPLGEMPVISFQTGRNAQIKTEAVAAWKDAPATSKSVAMYVSRVKLPVQQLVVISQSKTLQISDDFGNALSDVSIATDLSTENLASGVSLLVRAR